MFDANYPYLAITENIRVSDSLGPGTGGSGSYALLMSGSDPDDSSICAAYFTEFGHLVDFTWPASYFRMKWDIYFDGANMPAVGYFPVIYIGGYSGQGIAVNVWQNSGDTWVIELRAPRWTGGTDVRTSYTFSLNAQKDQWHTMQVEFTFATILDWATDDVLSDGSVTLTFDGTTVYALSGDQYMLSKGTNATTAVQGYGISFGFFGFTGRYANLELFSTPECPVGGGGETAAVFFG